VALVASARGTVWLGTRLAFRLSGGNAALISVLAVGVLFLTMLALGTLAIPQAASAQRQRDYAISPQVVLGVKAKATGLRTFAGAASSTRRWNGHSITRTYYSRGDSALVVPGVPQMPAVDQFYASAELQRLIRVDPTVAALFQGQRQVGTINDDGIVQPHELRAIIGISPDSELLRSVKGFGSDQRLGPQSDNTVLNGSVAIIVLLVVWLPGIAFIAIVTRLASRQRQRRARSMRLLGVSRSVTRLIHAGETMLIALPAAVLGALCYELFIHAVTRIPGTPFGYFTSDVDLDLWQYVSVILLLATTAGTSTAFSLRLDRRTVTEVPVRPPGRLAGVGLVLLVAGMVYLAATPILAPLLGTPAVLGMWAACGAVGAGLALAGPRLVVGAFTGLARQVRAGGTLVGLRLHSSGSATTLKLSSMLGVIIVLMLGTLAFMSILNGGSSANWNKILAGHGQVPVIVNDFGSLSLREVSKIYPSGGAVQTQTLGKGAGTPVVFGDCVDLEMLAGAAPEGCTGEPQWIKVVGRKAPFRVPTEGAVKVPGAGKVAFPSPTAVAEVKGLPEEFNAALLLPSRLSAPRPNGGTAFYLLVKNTSLNETLARLSAASPLAEFDLGALYRHNPDERQFPNQLQWLTAGAALSLMIGALALIAATLAETRDRGQRMRGLRLLGTPWTHLVRAHFWSAGAPLLLLGWAATLVGWVVARAIRGIDDRAVVSLAAAGWTAASVLVVGLIIVVVTLPDILRSPPQSRLTEA
jgi:hypothetical protein